MNYIDTAFTLFLIVILSAVLASLFTVLDGSIHYYVMLSSAICVIVVVWYAISINAKLDTVLEAIEKGRRTSSYIRDNRNQKLFMTKK